MEYDGDTQVTVSPYAVYDAYSAVLESGLVVWQMADGIFGDFCSSLRSLVTDGHANNAEQTMRSSRKEHGSSR